MLHAETWESDYLIARRQLHAQSNKFIFRMKSKTAASIDQNGCILNSF